MTDNAESSMQSRAKRLQQLVETNNIVDVVDLCDMEVATDDDGHV